MNRADRRALSRDIAKQMAAGGVDLAAQAQQPARLFLAWLYNENGARPTGAWVQSMFACAARSAALGFSIRPRSCETGPQLCKARNLLVRSFLEQTEDDYLLFSDTDIAFAPEDVKALLEADAPIAGALYFTAATGMEPWPVALEWGAEAESAEGADGDGKSPDPEPRLVPITLPEPPEDLAEGALGEWIREFTQPRRVDAVGAGLMLIRRDVVQAVAEAHNGRPFEYADERGEDVTFCLRADELGFETTLVLAARVGHVKAQVL